MTLLHLAQPLDTLSRADIASVMGVSVPTVTYNISKAEELLAVAVDELPAPEKAPH